MANEAREIGGIVDLASAYYGSAVLFAAIDCDVFARVERGEFAEAAPARGMRLLLDACVAEGLLEKRDGAYSNTQAGRLALIPGAPADLTKAIAYNRDVYPAWGRLAEFAKTGKPVERPETHLGEDATRTKAFAAAMPSLESYSSSSKSSRVLPSGCWVNTAASFLISAPVYSPIFSLSCKPAAKASTEATAASGSYS